jgi:signal transduction histidine kinase
LVEVQEAERRFLARELHDEIGQVLTGLKLMLEMMGRPGSGLRGANLAEAIKTVDDLMQRVRQLSLDLRPPILDDLGLMPALEWLFKRCYKQTGLRVRFEHMPLARRLPAQLEISIFRIVQEALTNVARHAKVHEATVRLWRDSRRRRLGVQVRDSGVGFDVPRALTGGASSGLASMRERAALLDGQFTLDSAPGAGTRLTVELPTTPAPPDYPTLTQGSP